MWQALPKHKIALIISILVTIPLACGASGLGMELLMKLSEAGWPVMW